MNVFRFQEVLLPLYSLASLILLKLILPNPHLPPITKPRGMANILEHFGKLDSHTVAVVPNNTEIEVIEQFLSAVVP